VSYKPHEIREHVVESQVVAQTFRTRVLKPIHQADDAERFPVVYMTDADDSFDALATLASYLQLSGETPRFILVGIGYGDVGRANLLRMRDLFTHSIRAHFLKEIERVARSPLVCWPGHLNAITGTTDAGQFLQFIRTELMPFVAAHYPALDDDNSYYGYSAGGAFGLYTLLTQPDTFKRYILGSPATSYAGHHFGVELVSDFVKSGAQTRAKVFMCVGELEEFQRGLTQYDLVTGYYLLVKFLKKSAIAGLDLISEVFPKETHNTAWTLAFTHGVRALFGRLEHAPPWL
jgi:predicted alpha/beta superfamily hydrolase